jgi:hypothetical protein
MAPSQDRGQPLLRLPLFTVWPAERAGIFYFSIRIFGIEPTSIDVGKSINSNGEYLKFTH